MLPLLFGKNKGAVAVIIGAEAQEKPGEKYDRGDMKKIAAKELITAIKDGNSEAVLAAFEALTLLCDHESGEMED